MADIVQVKAGDTPGRLAVALTDAAGVAVNLTGATVQVRLKEWRTETVVLQATATVDDAAGGLTSYAWAGGDLAVSVGAVWRADWVVTFAGGEVQTYPSAGYSWVQVVP